jgi:hypothetical protein
MEKYRSSSGDDIVCRANSPNAPAQLLVSILYSPSSSNRKC